MSWDGRDGSYTSEQLREVFGAHGPVADVVIRAPKQKRSGSAKGSAFVEMGTLEAAAAAARAVNGRADQPLLVVPFIKVSRQSRLCIAVYDECRRPLHERLFASLGPCGYKDEA